MTTDTAAQTALAKPDAPLSAEAAAALAKFDPQDAISFYFNPHIYKQCDRVAGMLAGSTVIPKHLQGNRSNCFMVVAAAFRWRKDPMLVAQHTFVTPNGTLGYEGKLIAAIINTSGQLAPNADGSPGKLKYEYFGQEDTPGRGIRVYARLKGESQDREIKGTVAKWATTHNGSPWPKQPDEQLAYRGARAWGRKHTPELVLGMDADAGPSAEAEEPRDVTPPAAAKADPLIAAVSVPVEVVTPAADAPKGCAHPGLAGRTAAPGKALVCGDCGEEFRGPDREPGADDDAGDAPQPGLFAQEVAKVEEAARGKKGGR